MYLQVLAGVGVRSKEVIKFKSIKIYAFGLCKALPKLLLQNFSNRSLFLDFQSPLWCDCFTYSMFDCDQIHVTAY
jgi:hypothetical protein